MTDFKYLRRVEDCHPIIKDKVWALLRDALNDGIRLDIVSGVRDFKKQQEVYAQGRTKPGDIVTNAPPGLSWHNYHVAVDVCPFDGKDFVWKTPDVVWDKIGKIGKAVGFEWGGDWPEKKRDRPHFQVTNGVSIRDALRTYYQSGLAGVWFKIFG